MGGLKRVWVEGFQGLEIPQGFGRGMEVKNLGFMFHSVNSHEASVSLGTTSIDLLLGVQLHMIIFSLPGSYYVLCA